MLPQWQQKDLFWKQCRISDENIKLFGKDLWQTVCNKGGPHLLTNPINQYLDMPTPSDNSPIRKPVNHLYPGKTEPNGNTQSKVATQQELGTSPRYSERPKKGQSLKVKMANNNDERHSKALGIALTSILTYQQNMTSIRPKIQPVQQIRQAYLRKGYEIINEKYDEEISQLYNGSEFNKHVKKSSIGQQKYLIQSTRRLSNIRHKNELLIDIQTF
jgi:hypothetical protein